VALYDLVRKQKKTASAHELIEKALREEIREYPPMTADSWMRVSSMGGICPRQEVLASRLGVTRREGIDPDLGMVFAMGHALHWAMQNIVMAETNRIVGSWRCTWCGEVYGSLKEGLIPRPERCMRCGALATGVPRINNKPDYSVRSDAFLFVEEWVGDYEYMIGGHPDGFFVDGDPYNFKPEQVIVLEFKSCSENSFVKYKKAPDFMHVIQSQTYMWLTGFKRAKIIYVNKGKFGMEGVVEHDVQYDQESIDLVKTAIKQIREGIAGGPLPPRDACEHSNCPRARSCIVAQDCFTTQG
jgi:hypothetical protein